MLELVAHIVLWMIFRPVVATIQAVVGILYPAKSIELRRLQWCAVALLCVGFGSEIAGVVALFWNAAWGVAILLIAAGWFALMSAGGIGWYVERRHLNSLKEPVHDS